MKRLLRWLLLTALLTAALCVGAMAEEPTVAGMYGITGRGAVLTPQTASGEKITATAQGDYTGFYVGAERFAVETSGLTADGQYLLLVLSDKLDTKEGSSTVYAPPAAENIVYIDQAAADGDGRVTFSAYPSSLTKGHYRVYVVGADKPYSSALAAEFDCYQPYTLGDVDGDTNVTANDALWALMMSVDKMPAGITSWTETQKLAADVDGVSGVSANDALWILETSVDKRVLN